MERHLPWYEAIAAAVIDERVWFDVHHQTCMQIIIQHHRNGKQQQTQTIRPQPGPKVGIRISRMGGYTLCSSQHRVEADPMVRGCDGIGAITILNS